MHFEVKFDLNHLYVPIEEDILNKMNALKIFEIIEDIFGISEVAIPNVSFSQVQEAMATLSTFLLQQQINVGELMTELLSLE